MAIGCLISGPLTENYGFGLSMLDILSRPLVIDQPIKRRKFSMIALSYVSVVALTLLWISENLLIIILARIVTMVASEIKYLAYSTYVIEVVGPDWRALTGNRFLTWAR